MSHAVPSSCIEEVLEEVYEVVEKTPEIIFEKVAPVKIVHIEDLKNRRMVFNVSDIDIAKSETASL